MPESIVDTMGQDELDRALATGQDREALEDYFGPELYRELSLLAGEVQRKSVRGGPPVAILPGIMGSELSLTGGRRDRVIWLNYLQIFLGRTQSLKLNGGADRNIKPTGVLERYYTKLRLRLQNKGYDARFIPFDWRKSFSQLGADLLEAITPAEKGRIHLVCHSMGGLVARAAALKSRQHFDRIVQLGTPNFGSLSPVTALRGANETARKVAALDVTQDQQDYIRLFASFPGLLEMIPNPSRYQHGDLFNRRNWPNNTDPAVTAKALNVARKVQQNAFADGDDRFWLIAGVDQETIVRAELNPARKEFTYVSSTEGDGTVPLALALLDNVTTYFIAEEHGALPNNSSVADAVDDILRKGATSVLPSTRAVRGAPVEKSVTESELVSRITAEGTRGNIPTSREQRHLLDEFLSVSSKDRETRPTPARPSAPGAETAPSEVGRSRSIVVGRRRQRGIEINLALGSITEVDARAVILGIYEKVIPSGAARALDHALDGAVGRYVDRRMFNGALGEVTIIPATRRQLRTEFVIFTGLGSFDQFSPGQLQTIGANLARMLVDTSIEDVALVPFGGGAGFASDVILRNFLAGFFQGLQDADANQNFRRLTICEIDDSKYATLVAEVLELTTTDLFDAFEVTVDQIELPPPRLPAARARRAAALGGPEPIYLIARRYSSTPDIAQDKGDLMECSILGGGTTAAILSDRFEVDPDVLDGDFRQLDSGRFSQADVEALGKRIADEFVGPKISGALAQSLSANPESPLIVLHDAGASRIPWEALRLEKPNPGQITPALQGGLSRRYLTRDLSVGKWLSARIVDDRLDILLIVNPTEDLPGAAEEGKRVEEIVSRVNSARLTKVMGREATKGRLLELFQSGDFDVVHYAGHAFFDPEVRHRSGILCAGGEEVLSGMDLAGLVSLPALVVCNACQSGQIRGVRAPRPRARKPTVRNEIGRNVSFAESFLRGGIANYVGTHWSVGDAAAMQFAQTLYTQLATGDSMNKAITQARQIVQSEAGSKDWADYIHYGDPDFVLKAGNE